MKIRRYLKFAKHERIALLLSFGLLALGILLTRCFSSSGWLAACGAVICIVGVLYALLDLGPELDARAKRMADLRVNLTLHSLIDSIEDESHTPMTTEDRALAKKLVEREVRPEVEAQTKIPKRRYLLVGAFVICFGTLVNGFSGLIEPLIRQ